MTGLSNGVSTRPQFATASVQFVLALIAGGGAANVYYHQPALGLLMTEFGSAAPTTIAASTMFGYAAGILLLVPLGDTWPRRTLIVCQQLVLAAALVVAALAPSLLVLALASAIAGAFATTAQQAIPFAAELAKPESRGRAVGRAMTGLLLGVLLARTVSGTIANQLGWRSVFAAAAGIALIFAAVAAFSLPKTRPNTVLPYRALLGSLFSLVREEPILRWATLTQGCIFASFNAFWASLVLHLQSAPFNLGPASAGLFGLVGAIGALVAPMSGRLSDRHGSRIIVIFGAILGLLSFGILEGFGHTSLIGIGVGALGLAIGDSLAMIANQTQVYSLRPEARGRLNTIYMTGMFFSGGLGASLGTKGYAFGGWTTVSTIGAAFAVLAVLAAVATPSRKKGGILLKLGYPERR